MRRSKAIMQEKGNDIILYGATQLSENSMSENATYKRFYSRRDFELLCVNNFQLELAKIGMLLFLAI